MDIESLIEELSQTSLHDLHCFRLFVDRLIDDPKKIRDVKKRLYPGKEVEYYDENENRYIPAKILQIKRNRLLIEVLEGRRKWDIPLYLIRLDGPGDLSPPANVVKGNPNVNQGNFKVGSMVAFTDPDGMEKYGKIKRLNQKTATIIVNGTDKWRVPYLFLSPVIEG